jgi:hypothetical protein
MFEKLFAKLDKAHMFLGLLVFMSGTVANYFHRLDADYVAFTTTVLGYLGAHLYIKQGGSDDNSNDSSTH